MTARNDAPCFVDQTDAFRETVAPLQPSREMSGGQNPAARSEQWSNACRRLRAELGEAVFSAWFARLDLDRIEDETAYLTVPTNFLKTWIQSHYVDKLCATLTAEAPEVKRCVVALRSSSRAAAPKPEPVAALAEAGSEKPTSAPRAAAQAKWEPNAKATAAAGPAGIGADALSGSPLDRRLTFANFVVGRSNQLACAAAQRVAEAHRRVDVERAVDRGGTGRGLGHALGRRTGELVRAADDEIGKGQPAVERRTAERVGADARRTGGSRGLGIRLPLGLGGGPGQRGRLLGPGLGRSRDRLGLGRRRP